MTMASSTDWNSSYLLGDDQISGWGYRYFFSFYSEFGEEKTGVIMEVFIFVTIFIFSIIANLSFATAVLKYPELRTVTNCFLLNLTVADISFVVGVPALVYIRVTSDWSLGNTICKILPYSQFVCGFVLLWTLTWISMDRHRCIFPPYVSTLTPKRAALLSALTWVVAAIMFLPVAFWFREQTVNDNRRICTMVFPKFDPIPISLTFIIPTLIISCVTPLTLFVYHYQRIFHKLSRIRDRWNENHASSISGNQDLFRQQENFKFSRHLRIIRILLLNVLVVLIMWLPITILMLLIYIDGRRPTEDNNYFLRSHHFIWSLQIALLNTVVNPLLYGILSENFRKSFMKMSLRARKLKQVKEFYNVGDRTKISDAAKSKYQFTNSISVIDTC